MNRSEFVAAVAERGGMSQSEADRALGVILEEIEAQVKKGDKLTIPGWLTVSTSPRAARVGRNPQTNLVEVIEAPANDTMMMGKYKNGPVAKGLGWFYFVIICICSLAAPFLLVATGMGKY